MKFRFAFFFLSVFFLTPCLWSAGPDGSGWLQLGLGTTTGNDGFYNWASGVNPKVNSTDAVVDVSGAFAPARGLGLAFACDENVVGLSDSEGAKDSGGTQLPSFTGGLNLYLGAWFGRPFVPGKTANADGWLGWPSFFVEFQEQSEADAFLVPDAHQGLYEYQVTSQNLACGLVYPLTHFFSLRAGYSQNLSVHALTVPSFRDPAVAPVYYGVYGTASYGATVYINLLPGAGADTRRAFLPGFGRRGQLALTYDVADQVSLREDWGGFQQEQWGIGAPVTDAWALRASVCGSAPGSFLGFGSGLTYMLSATYVYGHPRDREDHG